MLSSRINSPAREPSSFPNQSTPSSGSCVCQHVLWPSLRWPTTSLSRCYNLAQPGLPLPQPTQLSPAGAAVWPNLAHPQLSCELTDVALQPSVCCGLAQPSSSPTPGSHICIKQAAFLPACNICQGTKYLANCVQLGSCAIFIEIFEFTVANL